VEVISTTERMYVERSRRVKLTETKEKQNGVLAGNMSLRNKLTIIRHVTMENTFCNEE
jgi:hypothetical protein